LRGFNATGGEDEIDSQTHELCGIGCESLTISSRTSVFESDVPTLDPAELTSRR
jgi:hypothetical protein